tara:strand:+ start:764 stop:1036 length:273 start_codon:yes stop_codon:yes gene_type:complete
MAIFQQPGPKKKIPLATKLVLVFWIIIGLAILSFFAFSVFFITLMVSVVLFAISLFQVRKKSQSSTSNPTSGFQTRTYSSNKKDEDIIDI